jgi:hypothetical protein
VTSSTMTLQPAACKATMFAAMLAWPAKPVA